MLDNSNFINAPTRIWHLEEPQRNPLADGYVCATRPAGPEGRKIVAHGERSCEKIGERQKYARAVILSEAKNLALSSFAISHFHRQSDILRFAQDDRLPDSFTPSFAMGHILPPLRGSDGRGILTLTPMGFHPRLLNVLPSGEHGFAQSTIHVAIGYRRF